MRETITTSRHVSSITGLLSLRAPQRRSLEILDRVMESAQPHKGGDLNSALDLIRHFFVMAPNLTLYNKLLTDFTPNTPKYLFRGLAEFAISAP